MEHSPLHHAPLFLRVHDTHLDQAPYSAEFCPVKLRECSTKTSRVLQVHIVMRCWLVAQQLEPAALRIAVHASLFARRLFDSSPAPVGKYALSRADAGACLPTGLGRGRP